MPAAQAAGTLRRMSSPASLEAFERELNRLVAKFEKEFTAVTDPGYSEARLRQDYLDPFIRALGWDLENHAGLIQHHREVESESLGGIGDSGHARLRRELENTPVFKFRLDNKFPAYTAFLHSERTLEPQII